MCLTLEGLLSRCTRSFLLLFVVCAAPFAAEAAPQSLGKWQVLPAAGAEESMALSLKAEKAVKGWMKESVPTLTIKCTKGTSSVFIETGLALDVTAVDQQIVHIQLDNNRPVAQRWREVTNATVAASMRDATPLVKQLVQSQKFIFEFTPFGSAPAQAEFAVTGLSGYLPQLGRVCGWK